MSPPSEEQSIACHPACEAQLHFTRPAMPSPLKENYDGNHRGGDYAH
jgi:hypothetical protein